MEGIAGVNHPGPTGSGHARYPAAVDLMVGETNAAIEGALAGGADRHPGQRQPRGMYNLLPAALHPAARVLQGQKVWSMVPAPVRTPAFDVALFIGYHARAGHPRGTSPTPTPAPGRDPAGWPADRRVRPERDDPRRVGHPGRPGGRRRRPGRGGRRAGCPGRSGSWSRRRPAATRRPRSTRPSPRDLIRAGCGTGRPGRAAAGRARAPAGRSTGRHRGGLRRGVEADHAAIIPGAERVGDRGVRFASDDPVLAYRGFLAGNRLASIVDGDAPRRCAASRPGAAILRRDDPARGSGRAGERDPRATDAVPTVRMNADWVRSTGL